jgi:hypothetical protein
MSYKTLFPSSLDMLHFETKYLWFVPSSPICLCAHTRYSVLQSLLYWANCQQSGIQFHAVLQSRSRAFAKSNPMPTIESVDIPIDDDIDWCLYQQRSYV